MKLKKITQKQINNIMLRFWIYKGLYSYAEGKWDYEAPFFKPRDMEYLKNMLKNNITIPYEFPLKNTYFATSDSDTPGDAVIKGFYVFPNIQWLLSNTGSNDVEQIFLIPAIEKLIDYAIRLSNKELLKNG